MHILLVEDDPFIANAVCAALESEAHAVTWTPTGREGLAVIATGTPCSSIWDSPAWTASTSSRASAP